MSSRYHKPDNGSIQVLKDLADKLRIHSVTSTTASKSGHPTSCSSMAEIMSVLFYHTMQYSVEEPRGVNADRFVLSKGHAAPILYAAWAEAGLFPVADLMNLRKADSLLEGHPTPRLNFIDVATGSLGQGLSVACGMAYVGKYYDKASYKTYCLIGDGESAEGSIWEALSFAGVKNLDKLCVIIDVNKFGQSQETAFGHDLEAYKVRLDSFGFNTLVVDGHDVEALCKAFHEVGRSEKPTAIVAKTLKGKGFPGIEDEENWHGKALGDKSEAVIAAITKRMKNPAQAAPKPKAPANDVPKVDISNVRLSSPPSYKVGEKVATRVAYGSALKKLAESCSRVVALDGDMKNSTYANAILKVDPTRFIECFIAEQNLVGVGIGVACRDRAVVFCSSFSAFFSRAFDQLRMGAISQTNINVVGSHGGISIGEDGPSQMALEDIALFRSIPTATVFYPSDAVSCERAAELSANTKGICFIRVSRPGTSVLYPNDEQFQIGKAKIIQQSSSDVALVIGAGVTLDESLGASKILATKGIKIRIMDPFTIKPIDEEAIREHAKACGGRIVVVEDHYPEGGLGEAVKSAVAEQRDIIVHHLAVREVPKSGPPMELLEIFGISAKAIAAAVLKAKDM